MCSFYEIYLFLVSCASWIASVLLSFVHLQIHTYYEEYEEAHKLLITYKEKNIDNPNADRYLYELLTQFKEKFISPSYQQEVNSYLKVRKKDE